MAEYTARCKGAEILISIYPVRSAFRGSLATVISKVQLNTITVHSAASVWHTPPYWTPSPPWRREQQYSALCKPATTLSLPGVNSFLPRETPQVTNVSFLPLPLRPPVEFALKSTGNRQLGFMLQDEQVMQIWGQPGALRCRHKGIAGQGTKKLHNLLKPN